MALYPIILNPFSSVNLLATSYVKHTLGSVSPNSDSPSLIPTCLPTLNQSSSSASRQSSPPIVGTDICGVASGSIVSVTVNPNTVVTIFGVRDSSSVLKLDLSDPNPARHSSMEAESQGRAYRRRSKVEECRIFWWLSRQGVLDPGKRLDKEDCNMGSFRRYDDRWAHFLPQDGWWSELGHQCHRSW